MEHSDHVFLELPAAIAVIAVGVVVLALAWRRTYRGEASGVVLGPSSLRHRIALIAVVPTIGLAGIILMVLVVAALNGRLGLS